MESIKDKPDFCKTVLYKNIYTVMYYKTNKVIENFTFINYQDNDNTFNDQNIILNDSIQRKIINNLKDYKIDSIEKYEGTIIKNNWLNIDDSILTVINKISTNCIYDIDQNIYAWYHDKNNNPISLCFSYDFSISNPFEDEIDNRFIDENNNFSYNNINYKYNLLLEDIGEIQNNIINVIKLEDYLKFIDFKNIEKNEKIK